MVTDNRFHIPFAHLPHAAKVLFFFYSMAYMGSRCSRDPSTEEIRADLEVAWNTLKLTPDDLRDYLRVEDLLKPYFAKRASNEGIFRVPATESRRKNRKQNP